MVSQIGRQTFIRGVLGLAGVAALGMANEAPAMASDSPAHDPYVVKLGSYNYRGRCKCRWEGKRRWTRTMAGRDVLGHWS